MNIRHQHAHMEAAQVYANLSYCQRQKVGCVIVQGDRIVSIGYNGSLPGADNSCEDSDGITLPTVIHAEINAINKLDEYSDYSKMTLFCTRIPCPKCAPVIIECGFPTVFYRDFNEKNGLEMMQAAGISVLHIHQKRINK